MADLFNIAKPEGTNVGGGGGMHNELILVRKEDVEAPFPTCDPDTSVITGNINMKAGKTMHLLYTTEKTMAPTMTKQNGSNKDCYGFEVGISGFYPGVGEQILRFLRVHGDFSGFAIIRNIGSDGTATNFLLGEYYSPLSLDASEFTWGKIPTEDRGSTLTFKATQSGPYAIYKGSLTLSEPTTCAAGATSIPYKRDTVMRLSSGAAAGMTLTSITGMSHGEVITLEGTGGEFPSSIVPDEVFSLREGADWVASTGSKITLQAFAGGGTMQFIELSRS